MIQEKKFIQRWKYDLLDQQFISKSELMAFETALISRMDLFIQIAIPGSSDDPIGTAIKSDLKNGSGITNIDVKGNLFSEEPATYFIENAGIILFYPYLKNWFKNIGLIDPENKFSGLSHQMKGCQFLQYIATGKNDSQEYHLVLNKVLCGYRLESPVYGFYEHNNMNEIGANNYIKECMDNWQKLGQLSIEGFRNSFINRFGRLTEEEDHFLLRIDRKGWDVLLAGLPYPISVINLPWMQKPIFTEW